MVQLPFASVLHIRSLNCCSPPVVATYLQATLQSRSQTQSPFPAVSKLISAILVVIYPFAVRWWAFAAAPTALWLFMYAYNRSRGPSDLVFTRSGC